MCLRGADYSWKSKCEAHDHIKQHFNIRLQSGRVRVPGISTDSKNTHNIKNNS